MPAVVIVGAQWGDEGKGKVVDRYAERADVTAGARRRALDADAPAHCRRALRSAKRSWLFWRTIGFLLPALLPAWLVVRRGLGIKGPAISSLAVSARLRSAEEQAAACRSVLDRAASLPGARSIP